MHKSIEATIEKNGTVRLLEPVMLQHSCRAIVTILDESPDDYTILSETSLAADWNNPEEDEAWSHFQKER